jgi:hypothetical protein
VTIKLIPRASRGNRNLNRKSSGNQLVVVEAQTCGGTFIVAVPQTPAKTGKGFSI